MKTAKEIESFIQGAFELFSINIKDYFYFWYDEELQLEVEWYDSDGKIDIEAVTYAAEILGISVEDILNNDNTFIQSRMKKYPYFFNIPSFKHANQVASHGQGYAEMRKLELIFDKKLKEPYPDRYNYKDVIRRLFDTIKEIDEDIPGTFHKDADITNLRISTAQFCRFDKIKEMTESYIQIMREAKQLFVKAVQFGLNEDEIRDYNFLVSVLGLRDVGFPRCYLYYSNLQNVKDFYKELTLENFFDYIRFQNADSFKPWVCADFIDERELVQKYVLEYPFAKGEMRVFAIKVSQFCCDFTWSDAKPIQWSDEEEQMLADFDEIVGEEPIPLENRTKELTTIYVKKTKEELNNDNKTSDKIVAYCSPVNLGGLECPSVKLTDQQNIIRTINMVGRVKKMNYMERVIDKVENFGGGSNE